MICREPEYTMTANESERCMKCAYCCIPHGQRSARFCQFFLITGKRRGCEGGDKCTRYIKRRSEERRSKRMCF